MPLLELDDGSRLTEGPAIVQYLADQVPEKKLAPPNGTMARYRLQEWLNFITSELHKGIGGLFNPAMPEEAKALMREKAPGAAEVGRRAARGQGLPDGRRVHGRRRLPVRGHQLDHGTSASTSPALKNLGAFMERMRARPAVQAAMKAEGLLK